MPGREPRARRAGFTMVEVLVAFVLLALITVTVQRGMSEALAVAARAKDRFGAEMAAQSLLEAPLGQAGGFPQRGSMDGYDWEMRFEPLSGEAEDASNAPPWVPVRVTIEIRRAATPRLLAEAETIRLVRTAAP
ncbi:type II secretion system protein [Mesorhizobium sp. CAU 1741]|uniref:type II secretion system protein n=1 Tax=Mesorhizobium sp. CAU 1741 TaxID=3140366 RepID=UPI00325BA555